MESLINVKYKFVKGNNLKTNTADQSEGGTLIGGDIIFLDVGETVKRIIELLTNST